MAIFEHVTQNNGFKQNKSPLPYVVYLLIFNTSQQHIKKSNNLKHFKILLYILIYNNFQFIVVDYRNQKALAMF